MFSGIAALLSPRSWKIVGALVAVLAVLGLLYAIISAVKSWQIDTYNDGFRAGALNVQQQWDQSNAAALKEQRDQVVQDAINSNNAVQSYLGDILSRKPEVIRVAERTTKYVQTPDAGTVCLTPDGVELLQGHRDALGYPARPASGDTGAVPGVVPVPGPVEGQP